jgi:hypothetical protein
MAGRPSKEDVSNFWRRVLSPAQFAQMPKEGERACGKRPPGAEKIEPPIACVFRQGHECACRFFGAVETD